MSNEQVAENVIEQQVTEAPAIQKVEIVDVPKPSIEERMGKYLEEGAASAAESVPPAEDDAEAVEAANEVEETQDAIQEESNAEEEENAGEEAEELLEQEELHLETLADIAKTLEVDVADLYQLKIPMTDPAGNQKEISIGDWKDEVQSLVKTELSKAREQSQAAERQLEEHAQYLNHQVQTSQALISAMENDLAGNINSIDWQKLRESEPGEYAAKMQEQEAKLKQLDGYKQTVMNQLSQSQQKQAQEWEAKRAERMVAEERQLLAKIPDWVNEERSLTEKQAIGAYLHDEGFTPEEAGSVIDHRFIVMARKAMLYDQVKKASPAKKKIVKIGKKTVKPGAKQTSKQSASEASQRLRAKVKSEGTLDAAADYFKSLANK